MPLLGRDVKVIGPESKDVNPENMEIFRLESFRGREALGAPFRYGLTLLSEIPNIPIYGVLGQPLTVSIDLGHRMRFFNGVVTHFAKIGATHRTTTRAKIP